MTMNAEVGIDIVEIADFQIRIKRTHSLLKKLFSKSERSYCKGHPGRLAARFAAKEATKKAISVPVPLDWKEIIISHNRNGKPIINLPGKIIKKLSITQIIVSLSHTKTTAVACVVIFYGGSGNPS